MRFSPLHLCLVLCLFASLPHSAKSQSKNIQVNSVLKTQSILDTDCDASSGKTIFQDPTRRFYPTRVIKTSDNQTLVVGQTVVYPNYLISRGLIMKTDQEGNPAWINMVGRSDNPPYHYINYWDVIEVADGFIAFGTTENLSDYNHDLILTKISLTGAVLWHRIFKSKYWTNDHGSMDFFGAPKLIYDAAQNSVYVSAIMWEKGRSLTRFSAANGDIAWSRAYSMYDIPFDYNLGIAFGDTELYSFGFMLGNYQKHLAAYRINKANGDLVASKFYEVDGPVRDRIVLWGQHSASRLANGNFLVGGFNSDYAGSATNDFYRAALLEFDPSLNVVKGTAIRSAVGSNANNFNALEVFTQPDGSAILSGTMQAGTDPVRSVFIQTQDQLITKQREMEASTIGLRFPATRLSAGTDVALSVVQNNDGSDNKFNFMKLQLTDTSSECLGRDINHFYTEALSFTEFNFTLLPTDSDVLFAGTPQLMNESTTSLTKTPGCTQSWSCSFVDINSPLPTICINQTLTVVTRKDDGCGSTISLQYDTDGVQDVIKVNDSTYNFTFNKAWSGQIIASMSGCTLLMDSIFVEVIDSKGPVDLGADRNICGSNMFTLNAGKGYLSYLWQDGSTDSLFNVSQPGIYSVTVTDACSNVSSDMITVNAAPAVNISAGPDRITCVNDTIHLNAPSGFTNYTWTEAGIQLGSSQNLVVTSLASTQYYLSAEQLPGCFGYDTVTVIVNQPASIYLGADTTICNGQSITIDAGAGFTSYGWSDGSSSQLLKISDGGVYLVRAESANGCLSRDTIIVNARALPSVNLTRFSTICEGQTRVLNAGNFASYLWHDNSTSQTFTVSDPGTYYVTVMDNYGCEGSDTMTVTAKASSPKNFLPADTSFCSYTGVNLSSLQSMQSYRWSNGAQVSSITVNSAGSYWLQVTDANGCSGYDTINVKLKECLVGLYAPNAFTPNNDGKNDVFKALLYGEVESFELAIFNRWGQKIFTSTDRFKGWNGMNGAKPADTGLYIWICTYKLSGQEVRSEKGQVNLVR